MDNNLALNLIYSYVAIPRDETPTSYYKILYFFSEAGHVQKRTLSHLYEEQLKAEASAKNEEWVPTILSQQLLFEDLEHLNQFALSVCQEVVAPEVFILSVQDYNLGLESIRDIRSFRDLFRRYGNCLVNPNLKREKGGVLGKFFGH